MFFMLKVISSALIIAVVSELGKRFTWIAAIIASLPLISILAMTWLYIESKSINKIISLSHGIFWAVLPSLLFFIVLPSLLKSGLSFPLSMLVSIFIMFLGYSLYIAILKSIGITL